MDGRNVSLASKPSRPTVSLPVYQPERDGISVSSPAIDRVDPCDTICRRGDRASLRGRRKPPHDGVRKSERCNLYGALISTRRPRAGRYAQSFEPRPRGTSLAEGELGDDRKSRATRPPPRSRRGATETRCHPSTCDAE